MNKISQYRGTYFRLPIKKSLEGIAAMEAVKQDGDALQYVEARWFD